MCSDATKTPDSGATIAVTDPNIQKNETLKQLEQSLSTLKKRQEELQAAQDLGSKLELNNTESKIKSYRLMQDELQKVNVKSEEGKAVLSKVKKETSGILSVFASFGTTMTASVDAMKSKLGGLGKVLGSAMPMAAAKMRVEFLQTMDANTGGLLTAQKETLAFQKSISQAGQSFGQTFEKAHGNTRNFLKNWTDTVNTVKATPEEVNKVREAFKDVMPIQEQVRHLSSLKSAHSGLSSTISATNAALLVSAATGMDAGKAAQWMGQAITELGNTTEEAAQNFARISWAADKSGLGFEKVGQSIMSAADALKMWGGTVSGVAPVYKAFSDSLAGTGRQGLTPQLLQSFVSGLQGMQFGTRALLGLQAPGGGGKGAIGAGLQMEADLEKGPEGMKNIAANLSQTLKNFGGGKVVTREQALSDPALERNFMVQRQLLMQTMNLDQASANKTLAMLQSIDQNGLSAGGDTADQLDTLLKSGEKTNESTQDILQKAMNESVLATQNSTKDIVNAIKGALGGNVGGFVKTLDGFITKLTGSSSTNESIKLATEGLAAAWNSAKGVLTGSGTPNTDKQMAKKTKESSSESDADRVERIKLKVMKQARTFASELNAELSNTAPVKNERPISKTKQTQKQSVGVGKTVTREEANPLEKEFMVQRAPEERQKDGEVAARAQITTDKRKTDEDVVRKQIQQMPAQKLDVSGAQAATKKTQSESLQLRQPGTQSELSNETKKVDFVFTVNKQKGNEFLLKVDIDQESMNKGIHNAHANGQH